MSSDPWPQRRASGVEGPPPPPGPGHLGWKQRQEPIAKAMQPDPGAQAAKPSEDFATAFALERARQDAGRIMKATDLSKVPDAELRRTFIEGTGADRTAAALELAVRLCSAGLSGQNAGEQPAPEAKQPQQRPTTGGGAA